MSQLSLLKRILRTPGIFSTPGQRATARDNLDKKIAARDKRRAKRQQLKINF